MLRHIGRAVTLAVALIAAAVAPLCAQDQKGTLIFAVETLGAQTLDPILEGRPGNAVYQAVMYDSLVGFDLEKGGVGPGDQDGVQSLDDYCDANPGACE